MIALLRAIQGMGQPGNFPEIDPTRHPVSRHQLRRAPLARLPALRAGGDGGCLARGERAPLPREPPPARLQRAAARRPRGAARLAPARRDCGLRGAPERAGPRRHAPPRALPLPRAARRSRGSRTRRRRACSGSRASATPSSPTRRRARPRWSSASRPCGRSPALRPCSPRWTRRSARTSPGRHRPGHFQYDPAQTPSCVDAGQTEGHFCAQIADEVNEQVLHFYSTALSGAAEIIDPF